ncbi:beta-propeller domain-containing protein [Aquibacillus koreensis]|uniref:Beta-propeller domain-containing protein n=1 Tax=Aquibacillus koreensis TaxID=279446 RepID=A0A9X3WJB8_9BACI|nr:beta-propeller domain-containing protein [Aquibacillus koreensis]MCT2534732.1 beta-propeller domain-containing protein [Aquibacillus koreensis]MDC3419658.1 beta-propeller domain-containing protein [Aquibacillus koreensis]
MSKYVRFSLFVIGLTSITAIIFLILSSMKLEPLPSIHDNEHMIQVLDERIERMSQNEEAYRDFSMATSPNNATGNAASAFSSGASTPAPASQTNVQVDGIDEGDIVKNDGRYVYFEHDNNIVIASTKGAESKVITKIKNKAFYLKELYLHEDYLVSIGYSDTKGALREDEGLYKTTVYIYDISDIKNPALIREFTMEGTLTSSRKKDNDLYLVMHTRPHPSFYQSYDDDHSVDLSEIDLQPYVKDTAVSNEGAPVPFEAIHYLPESTDHNFLSLISLDLDKLDEKANIKTYLGASENMYMSNNHIYVSALKYNYETNADGEIVDRQLDTQILQFKINNGIITYRGSAEVEGYLINQFAMDEQNGTFRVAVTDGFIWRDNEPSTNNLYTFDTKLKPLGSVEGLAKDERIYSVRFMEDVAYIVTFRETDPLFVIDLKDARNPKVLGELKIPGFSNYLHPLDEDHLIGFGHHTVLEDVPDQEEPRVLRAGLKISIFDVSDPTNPKEAFMKVLGRDWSGSEVNRNHHALYKHPEKNLYGIPAQLDEVELVNKEFQVDTSSNFEGALLFHISPESGITLKDTITHQKNTYRPEWEYATKRMISVGNMLYTLSEEQMKIYDLEEERVIKTVEF